MPDLDLEPIATAAKALAKPITKLITVVAAGCGNLYEPTGIVRRAKAEGEALVIMEEARSRASEVSIRAAERLITLETRRQENIEAIAYLAEKELPSEVSDDPVSPDWVTRFFREAQDVSDERMQHLWAKLLAGEVAAPGSYSPRTLGIVADLTAAEAELFHQVCSLVSKVYRQGQALFVGDPNAQYLLSNGLGFIQFTRLDAAGLVTFDAIAGRSWGGLGSEVFVERPGNVLYRLTKPGTANALNTGKVALTQAGEELFRVAGWEPRTEHDAAMTQGWTGEGWKHSVHTVVERLADGNVRFAPAPPAA